MTAHRTNATLGRCAKIVVFLLTAAAFLAPGALHAQAGGGTVASSVTVLAPPVSGSGIQEMSFGSAQPGDVIDVNPGAAATGATTTAAGWLFGNIRKGHQVRIDLSLPAALARGSATAPIDWDNAGYGTVCIAKTGAACQLTGSFNPGTTPSQTVDLPTNMSGNNFDVVIYVGARLTIPYGIPTGVYTASATAVVTYLN